MAGQIRSRMTTLNLLLIYDDVISALAGTNRKIPTFRRYKSTRHYRPYFPTILSARGVRKLIGTKSESAIIVLSGAS